MGTIPRLYRFSRILSISFDIAQLASCSRTAVSNPLLCRFLSLGPRSLAEQKQPKKAPEKAPPEEQKTEEKPPEEVPLGYNTVPRKKWHMRPVHSVDSSIAYLKSQAFKDTYKGLPPWRWYRRNIFVREIWQSQPRMYCVNTRGKYSTNNPCPLCRDEYFVVDYRNVELLKMFMNPSTGEAMHILRSGLCQDQHRMLQVAIMKARDHGYLTFEVPFRHYKYKDYYPWWEGAETQAPPETPKPLDFTMQQSYIVYPEHNKDRKMLYDLWWREWEEYAKKYESSN